MEHISWFLKTFLIAIATTEKEDEEKEEFITINRSMVKRYTEFKN